MSLGKDSERYVIEINGNEIKHRLGLTLKEMYEDKLFSHLSGVKHFFSLKYHTFNTSNLTANDTTN